MTVISILAGDFEILLDDEKNQNGGSNAVAGMRTIQKAVASPTIITTQTLYSAVAEAMDDFIAMGFRNGMLPTTPNAFTLPNQYFMPRSTTEFLKEGAITGNYSVTASPDTNGNGVYKVVYTGGTNFVANDIGKNIIQADTTDSGTLLDFDIDPNGDLVAWIRPTDSTPTTGDSFDGTGALSVVADSGTGVSTSSTAALDGITEYAAIQAIGSVPTATDVYVYQNRFKIASSDAAFQWWSTDTAVSLGIISILLQTQSAGVVIADGDVEVFARKYTALYDNFRLNVSAGGFSALPLASSPDINNTTGYRRTGTLASVTGTATVGNGIYEVAGGSYAAASKRGVITATNGNTILEYYLVGDLTDFGNAEAIQGHDFDTGADDAFDATTGTVAVNLLGPTDPAAGEGGTVTLALGHVDVDHTGNGTNEPYSITVDCIGDVSVSKVYEALKYFCRRGIDETGLFGVGTNVPGESYRGIDATFEFDTPVGGGLDVDGDDLFTTTGGSTWTARLVAYSGGTTPTYITTMDQQTSVDVIVNDDVVEDEAGSDSVAIHSGGTEGIRLVTSPKSSPLGTFTGTTIFGAPGVSFINITVNPTAYILTDDFGTLNNPPTTVTFTVSNTLALDRIFVARDTGVDGIIDKDQFGGIETPAGAYNQEGNIIIRVAGTIDAEVPQAGVVRIVETTLRQEHHYVYDSRTAVSTGEFTLRSTSSFAGTADDTGGTTSPTLLNDTGQSFQTDGVEPGMLMQDTTNGDFYEIVAVLSETQCSIIQIFGTGGTFANLDLYEINKLIQLYATADNMYDLILDVEATGTSVNNSFTKTPAANFDVVVNVRQGKIILPFTLNQLQGDGNTTVTVVRQPDTIAV